MSSKDKIVKESVNFLIDLIKCKTISQKFNELKTEFEKCKELIINELESLGFNCKEIKNNIISEFDVGKEKTLGFLCHYDVVPAENEGWITNPFDPVKKEGKVFGRGASDDKGGIASFVCGIKQLLQNKDFERNMRGNIKFVCTFDEEVGGKNGILFLIKRCKDELFANSYYILDVEMDNTITMGCSGIISGKIISRGKKIKESYPFVQHSAYPFFITNPIHKIITSGNRIVTEFIKKEEKIDSKYDCEDNPLGREKIWNRFSITMLNGGEKENVIPAKAELTFNWRLIPEDDVKNAKSRLNEFIKSIDEELEIMFDMEENGYCSEESDDLDHLKKILDLRASVSFGFIDGAHIWKHLRIPAFGYGPCKKNANIHGRNEFIEISTIRHLGKVICDYLTYPLS